MKLTSKKKLASPQRKSQLKSTRSDSPQVTGQEPEGQLKIKKIEEKSRREMEIRSWLERVFDESFYKRSEFGSSALFIVLLEELGHADLARLAEAHFRSEIAPNLEDYFEADALAEFDCEIERVKKEVFG